MVVGGWRRPSPDTSLSPCWRQVSPLSIAIVAFFFLPLSTPVGNPILAVAAACDLKDLPCKELLSDRGRVRGPVPVNAKAVCHIHVHHAILPFAIQIHLWHFCISRFGRAACSRSRDDLPMRKAGILAPFAAGRLGGGNQPPPLCVWCPIPESLDRYPLVCSEEYSAAGSHVTGGAFAE